jgi:4-aminobutyrate aminotransferase-like enzyme
MGPAYSHFYKQPVHLVRGEGMWLFDADGKRYLDCYNNVASVGHCHPEVVEALSRQAATLNTHTRYLHSSVVEYAELLGDTLPGDLSVCSFVCTGTEANDLAYRIAAGQRWYRSCRQNSAAIDRSPTSLQKSNRPTHTVALLTNTTPTSRARMRTLSMMRSPNSPTAATSRP